MAFVPSYRPDRRSRAPEILAEDRERWSVRRFLAILFGVSAVGWAALAGLAALLAG
jgi:hypothetical protein